MGHLSSQWIAPSIKRIINRRAIMGHLIGATTLQPSGFTSLMRHRIRLIGLLPHSFHPYLLYLLTGGIVSVALSLEFPLVVVNN